MSGCLANLCVVTVLSLEIAVDCTACTATVLNGGQGHARADGICQVHGTDCTATVFLMMARDTPRLMVSVRLYQSNYFNSALL
jgi:hypothetical protein